MREQATEKNRRSCQGAHGKECNEYKKVEEKKAEEKANGKYERKQCRRTRGETNGRRRK